MAVKILEVCRITPPPGSPTDDISLPLTFFDLYSFIFPPVEILLFYEIPPNHPHPILLSKLKNSLSCALRQFLPVAGNLVWPNSSPNPIIRYQNGDGVLLTITESDADFYHLTGKRVRECTSFNPLVAHIMGSGTQIPVIAFKVTLFPQNGICIGVTVHHSLFDATSTALFMNAWAYFVKFGENRGLGKELMPSFDRKSIRERYSELENSFIEVLKRNGITLEKTQAILGPERLVGIVRGTFVLSRLDILKLKELVSAQLENNNQVPRLSTFTVAYAYVILCLIKVKTPKNNRVNLSFAFECRGRLDPPLPSSYFGNCVGACDAYFDTEQLLGRDGMVPIVEFINKNTRGLDDDKALRGAEEWLPSMFRSAADSETMRVFVAGSSRFEYQSVDFGWGRPRKADIASIDGTGGVSFTQGGDENKGGIEVELSLKEGEMENFAYVFAEGLGNIKPIKAAL